MDIGDEVGDSFFPADISHQNFFPSGQSEQSVQPRNHTYHALQQRRHLARVERMASQPFNEGEAAAGDPRVKTMHPRAPPTMFGRKQGRDKIFQEEKFIPAKASVPSVCSWGNKGALLQGCPYVWHLFQVELTDERRDYLLGKNLQTQYTYTPHYLEQSPDEIAKMDFESRKSTASKKYDCLPASLQVAGMIDLAQAKSIAWKTRELVTDNFLFMREVGELENSPEMKREIRDYEQQHGQLTNEAKSGEILRRVLSQRGGKIGEIVINEPQNGQDFTEKLKRGGEEWQWQIKRDSLNRVYPNYEFDRYTYPLNNNNDLPSALSETFAMIRPNHITIFMITREGGGREGFGHAFIIGRTDNGAAQLIDPQLNTLIIGDDQIIRWLTEGHEGQVSLVGGVGGEDAKISLIKTRCLGCGARNGPYDPNQCNRRQTRSMEENWLNCNI